MSYNKVIAIGNLGRDPELRYTPTGKAVCNFSIATTETWKSPGGQKNEKTIWFKVTAWGVMGENASKYLAKGRPVYVEGRLGTETWTDRDGKERTDFTINASEIQYLGESGSGGGGGGGGRAQGPRAEYDQRRAGTDDHDQRTGAPDDALPLDGGKKNDDIPF